MCFQLSFAVCAAAATLGALLAMALWATSRPIYKQLRQREAAVVLAAAVPAAAAEETPAMFGTTPPAKTPSVESQDEQLQQPLLLESNR